MRGISPISRITKLDGFRALLSIGLATDQPDFIRWAGSAFRTFLENVIGRDGGYYENSEMYAYFSGTLMQDVAELLYHYDPGKYASPDDYPPAEALVGLKNAFDHPRLVRLCLEYTELIRACGRIPSYGNTKRAPGLPAAFQTPGDALALVAAGAALLPERKCRHPAAGERIDAGSVGRRGRKTSVTARGRCSIRNPGRPGKPGARRRRPLLLSAIRAWWSCAAGPETGHER